MPPPTPQKSVPKNTESSARAQEHAALLKEALAQPGVREAMNAYNDWAQVEPALAAYREATREEPTIIATDHANFDPSEARW